MSLRQGLRRPDLRRGPAHLLRRPAGTRRHPSVPGNVLRGRRVPPERVEEVAHHYELFGGVSPITELTRRQADGLRVTARGRGPPAAGVRRHAQLASVPGRHACARCAPPACAARSDSSPRPSTRYSSCEQYRENVAAARAELRSGGADIDVTYVGSWFDHPLFVEANAAHVREALRRLPAARARRRRGSSAPRTAFRCRWRSGRAIASSWRRRRVSSRARPAMTRLGARVSEPQRPAAGSLARA